MNSADDALFYFVTKQISAPHVFGSVFKGSMIVFLPFSPFFVRYERKELVYLYTVFLVTKQSPSFVCLLMLFRGSVVVIFLLFSLFFL